MQPDFKATVNILKIIVLAMAAGLSFFTIIAFSQGQWDPLNFGPLTTVACLFAIPSLAGSIVIPRLVTASGRKQIRVADGTQPTRDDFTGLFQTTRIIGLAISEGAGFLASISYMLEGHYASLIVVLFCLAGILLRFPSQSSAEQWADEQIRILRMT